MTVESNLAHSSGADRASRIERPSWTGSRDTIFRIEAVEGVFGQAFGGKLAQRPVGTLGRFEASANALNLPVIAVSPQVSPKRQCG